MATSAARSNGDARSTHGRAEVTDLARGATAARVGGPSKRTRAILPEDDHVLELTARRLRVLGHPIRLQLLEVLANGPRSVSDLANAVVAKHDLVSKHLTELLRCEMVVRRQEGNFALYSLPDAVTIRAVALIARSVMQQRERLALAAESAIDGEGSAVSEASA